MRAVRLVPATIALLSAYLREPDEMAVLLATPLPEGWPEFPEAFPNTLKMLREHPEHAQWWMYLFLDSESGTLVGSGGFAGEPVDGTVEIGYEIAPAYRRRGYGSAAARALVEKALASGQVRSVIAHTLASDERSAGVLRRNNFVEIGRVSHPDDGDLVRWRRAQPGNKSADERNV
jgi:ribosomal-protein-alanine N-acetyltransferase